MGDWVRPSSIYHLSIFLSYSSFPLLSAFHFLPKNQPAIPTRLMVKAILIRIHFMFVRWRLPQ
jgi:hypothetical protein